MAANQERTYLMIMPDGVQRGLVGDIIKRFEAKGFKLVAMKFVQVIYHSLFVLMHIFKNMTICFSSQLKNF